MHPIILIYKQFKPATSFLLQFLALYLVGNLLYGWYVTAWHPQPDPVTHAVTAQSARLLSMFYQNVEVRNHSVKPTTAIWLNGGPVVSVYEGCNGLNVAVVFIAFVLAYGPRGQRLLWFIPLGLLVLHIANLTRISLLFAVSVHLPRYLYFTHKFLFTSFIFFIVFLLWAWWILKLSKK
jgi:exosortase family protein XrtF